MLRLLSWTGCDKINSPEMKSLASGQDAALASTVSKSALHKRKLSGDHQSQNDRKRARATEAFQHSSSPFPFACPNAPESNSTVPLQVNPSGASSSLPSPPETQADEPEELLKASPAQPAQPAQTKRLETMRNVIQTQIGLEILLKHKELRLIDQEIAKCQASLEQLRRCQEIPYPATQPPSMSVTNGTGLALRTSFATPLPRTPAPWGVQNGPYSRHYAKWLLQDPAFEGGEPEVLATPVGKSPMKFRSQTRGMYPDTPQTSSQSRSQRGGKLKSLPAGYGQPKEKATGPMIIKRKSDGATVKLVCPDCGRFDFGSAQGFINHCRIGHGRSFASHDAAADACGEVVEVDDTGAMIGVEPAVTPTTGNVHPLIRSAKLLQPAPPRAAPRTASTADHDGPKSKGVSPDFKGSNLTPNLSDLVKGRGLGLDLQDLVAEAKTKIELPESDSEDDEMDVNIPVAPIVQGRHLSVAGSKQPANPARAPVSSTIQTPDATKPSSLRGGDVLRRENVINIAGSSRPRGMILPLTGSTPADLQPSDPSPISESNQAPSLVDDDEEFEPHSPSSSSVSDDHDMGEVEFEVQDDENEGTNGLRGPEFQPSCAHPGRPTHARRPSAIRRHGEDREQKHVSFVSPSPARELIQPRSEADRKSRKA
jgi:ADA HAT complex component 1